MKQWFHLYESYSRIKGKGNCCKCMNPITNQASQMLDTVCPVRRDMEHSREIVSDPDVADFMETDFIWLNACLVASPSDLLRLVKCKNWERNMSHHSKDKHQNQVRRSVFSDCDVFIFLLRILRDWTVLVFHVICGVHVVMYIPYTVHDFWSLSVVCLGHCMETGTYAHHSLLTFSCFSFHIQNSCHWHQI